MNALVWVVTREVAMRSVPVPVIDPQDIPIWVCRVGSYSLGLRYCLGNNVLRIRFSNMGYESSGEITALGEKSLYLNNCMALNKGLQKTL